MDTLAKRLKGNPIPVCVPVDEAVVNLVDQTVTTFSGDRLGGHRGADHGWWLQPPQNIGRPCSCARFDPSLEDVVLGGEDAIPLKSSPRGHHLRGHPPRPPAQPCETGAYSGTRRGDRALARTEGPARNQGDHVKDDSTEAVEMEDKGALAALAFKVQLWMVDDVFARIYRGTLSAETRFAAGSGKEERVARIFDVNAGNKKRIDTAVAGQIVLLAGLKHATTGDTLCRAEHEVLPSASSRDPVRVAISQTLSG